MFSAAKIIGLFRLMVIPGLEPASERRFYYRSEYEAFRCQRAAYVRPMTP